MYRVHIGVSVLQGEFWMTRLDDPTRVSHYALTFSCGLIRWLELYWRPVFLFVFVGWDFEAVGLLVSRF